MLDFLSFLISGFFGVLSFLGSLAGLFVAYLLIKGYIVTDYGDDDEDGVML